MGFSQARNTGVGYHALLQGPFPTQRSNPSLMSPALASGFFTTSAIWSPTFWGPCFPWTPYPYKLHHYELFCPFSPLFSRQPFIKYYSFHPFSIPLSCPLLSSLTALPRFSSSSWSPDWDNSLLTGSWSSPKFIPLKVKFWSLLHYCREQEGRTGSLEKGYLIDLHPQCLAHSGERNGWTNLSITHFLAINCQG